ncbi:FAD:protein FMN transferase [Rhodobacteraceae bacterium N5(2021)]|uniref:FAD:protein FMN transferase n=1 Tax=Gymnodinialimonas phycosphaerae TaxID=2841589 RepID=A0A975YEQ3_9RHOB|nr:FAD:protein FMN transferase [Gymnodinialimonas phycosphaerae]MBY4893865.1 FAD:protein FMN transferase [Gymnodinialimonas phycosphaerae]
MKLTRRGTILGGMALALAPGMSGAQSGILGGIAFGSTWRLVCETSNPAAAVSLIENRIAAIDGAMSPYRASSTLSQFNRAEVDHPVNLPAPMARVVDAALRVSRDTGGAFDPTAGPLVSRFGYGPITGQPGRVADLDLRGTSLRKAASRLTLDLCGIAKGFALDCLFEDLIAEGMADFFLELGGEVRAAGTHPSGRPWHVAIEDPLAPHFTAHTIVAPGQLALATSGHGPNGLRGAIEVSHVIDPRSARPATGDVASVSVLAATGMQADAMATALLAMGNNGPGFARQNDISALFIPGPFGTESPLTTGQFSDHIIA